jgi:methyl acetate hydrolase
MTTIATDDVLASAAGAGEVPGVVAAAADASGVVYAGAFGERVLGSGVEMTLDTVFWLASMTKAVTSVAAMQLVERGVLELDAPLEQLAGLQVLDGFDDAGAPRLRAPKRLITLRHLLTHTAGFGYDTWNADLAQYAGGTPLRGLAALGGPLVFDPGDRWEYGVSTDWVGRVVEDASGQSLEAYFRAHVLDPLGMRDTSFLLRPDQRSRLAPVHRREADGTLTVSDFAMVQPPEWFMGGGGLYSTALDYMRFLLMLLHDGASDGVQILRADTVAQMLSNQIGSLDAGVLRTQNPFMSNDHDPFPGKPIRWGLAGMLTLESCPGGRGAGSLAWAGMANTYF